MSRRAGYATSQSTETAQTTELWTHGGSLAVLGSARLELVATCGSQPSDRERPFARRSNQQFEYGT